ncbi:DUF6731 family protein [Chromobacterium sp. CV08]|uniref:DUF6731 family protein n=1 Tax=Chromobacterium sp. CV08 TaxID=3133274 RepID=UPI003DAA20DA
MNNLTGGAMAQKEYKVRFYAASFLQDNIPTSLIDYFTQLHATYGETLRAITIGENQYQIKNLTPSADGRYISGAFAKYRKDSPLIGSPTGDEEVFKLTDGKSFLEKNNFILHREQNDCESLIYQMSLEGGHPASFSRYINLTNPDRLCSFDDILTSKSLEELFRGRLIRAVAFRIAKPQNKTYQPDPEDTWTKDALEFLDSTGGTFITSKVSIKAPHKGLKDGIIEKIKNLLNSSQTRALRIKVEDADEPIDLMAERVMDKIRIELNDNGHPAIIDIIAALITSRARQLHHLDHLFGG